MGSGGNMVASLKYKGNDGRATPGKSPRLNLTQPGKTYQVRTWGGSTVLLYFLNSVGGGAWPLLVGGLPCQADSDNERDLFWLISRSLIII